MNIGTFGIWTGYRMIGEENGPAAAALAEKLGYSTFWLGGSPRLPAIRPLLEATERIVIATGIVNIWDYVDDPAQLAAEHAALTAEFPGRVLLGIGISHPEAIQRYTGPLTTSREFLDGLDAAPQPVPQNELCIAALGPKMLDLAGERTLGTHPYFVPSEHARVARERLGTDALVATEVAVVVSEDGDAKAKARKYAELYLGLRNYTNNLRRLGFSDDDIANGGSDRLIDAVVPQGSAEQLAGPIRAHLDAGANHVCVQTVGVRGVPEREWTELAEVLLG